MSDMTQTRAEDAISRTNDFLAAERGTTIDGDFAGLQVAERVATARERAEAVLCSVPHPNLDGLYVPLSQHNADSYAEAAAVLPGYMVLVPSALVEGGTSVFYPAVVSEDGLKTGTIRLHVLRQPYRGQIGYAAATTLSAAGQSETKGIGEHGHKTVGVEAEHFATLLAVGADENVQSAWQAGRHVNHAWRGQPDNSVTTAVSKRLFGPDVPQSTVTITKRQIETGQAMLLWHKGMRDEETGSPETATQDKALVIVQGLGYEAMLGIDKDNPNGTLVGKARRDTVKRMIA